MGLHLLQLDLHLMHVGEHLGLRLLDLLHLCLHLGLGLLHLGQLLQDCVSLGDRRQVLAFCEFAAYRCEALRNEFKVRLRRDLGHAFKDSRDVR